ncbi:DUF3299 domain-containing protein [Pelomicrobium sp.]|jgi:hypothetical protein|uniref:DUF3299 domain-containing protein n=1 Tax=Pelomicrobium sp. TaxID=2815319 RepID=UPI002FDDB38F
MTKGFATILAAASSLAAFAVLAQTPKENPFSLPVPPEALNLKPLPEIQGVVSWRTLKQVEMVKDKGKMVPQFSDHILALDRKEVKLQGFMLPLSAGEKQTHFILSALPPTCPFCLPAGPDSVVEVKSKVPVKFTYEPVVLSGRFAVLKDDPMGLFYRLIDAEPVKD